MPAPKRFLVALACCFTSVDVRACWRHGRCPTRFEYPTRLACLRQRLVVDAQVKDLFPNGRQVV